MSVRRINQTGRKRISREHARIELRSDDAGALSYEAALSLDSYGFPPGARILIEAYRQHSYERFDHGTAGTLSPERMRPLSLFRAGDQLQFRVKVVDLAAREGCLVGEADRLKADVARERTGERVSLLPAEGRDLGNEAWRLEIDDGPLLLVNNQLGDWKVLARTPAFIWLVYPAALREILRHILITEDHRSAEDPGDWRDRWLMAMRTLKGGQDIPASSADHEFIEEWITDVVEGFARKHHLLDKFGRQTFGGEDS